MRYFIIIAKVGFYMNSEKQNRYKLKPFGVPLKWSKVGPLLVLPTLVISGCGLISQQPAPTPIPLPVANSTNNLTLKTHTVEMGDILASVSYSGKVAVAEEEDLFFRRSGRVQTVAVEDGDFVQEDTLIAELDTTLLNIDLEAALIDVEIATERLADAEQRLLFDTRQAELNLEITELGLESYKERFAQNADQFIGSGYRIEEGIKIQELQKEKAELALVQIEDEIDPIVTLNLQRAELNLKRVQQSLLDSKIRAPFDGEVRFITLTDDDREIAANAYAAVARVIKPDSLSVELNLSRTQLEILAEGTPVTIRRVNSPNELIAGEIDTLPRPFGTGTGTLTTVSITNSADKSKLIEGTTVDVQIQLANQEDVLRIPVAALYGVQDEHYVYVRNSSEQQEAVDVEIGTQNDEFVEIVAGLAEGQVVVER